MLEAPPGKTSSPPPSSTDAAAGLAADLVRAVFDQEWIVVVTGKAGSGKTRLLREVAAALTRSAVRVVKVGSPDRLPLALRGILDQVIDPAREDDAEDRVRQFCAELTQCQGGERQIALVIDDADVLTPRAIEFLETIAGAAEPRPLPLHVILFGRPQLWDLLSRANSFGPHRIATRFVLPDVASPSLPESELDADAARRRDQALSSLWSRFDEAVATPAPAGTALAISRPAAEVFRFGGTPSRPVALSRARPTRWLATALLVAAPSTGALYGSLHFRPALQFRPAATLAGLINVPDVAGLVGRLGARSDGTQETAAQPPRPAKVAVETAWLPTAAPAPPEAHSHAAMAGVSAPVPPGSLIDPLNAGEVTAAGKARVPDDVRQARTPDAEPAAAAPTWAPPDRSIDLTAGAVGPSLGETSAVETKAAADASAVEQPPPSVASIADPAPETAKLAEPVAIPPPPPAPPVADLPAGDPPELLALLIARGNALLKTGDVGGARLMYEQAARSGSRDAAVAAGRTYDPNFFDYPRSRRITSDRQAAAAWYRQALAQGDRKAAGLLAQLGGGGE